MNWHKGSGTSGTPSRSNCRKLQNRKAAKDALRLKPLGDALEQWLSGMKTPGETSVDAYRSTTRKIRRWADRVGVGYVSDVTPALLDEWRSSWSLDAKDKANRLALTTQAALLTRVKAFFRWATAMEYTTAAPPSCSRP